MKKTILLVLLALLLSSCGYIGTQRPFPQQDIHVGTQGLSTEFLESAPPSTVKQNTAFPIYIEVKNEGVEDIRQGYYKIIGADPTLLTLSPSQGTFSLKGRSLNNPLGDRELLQINGRTSRLSGDQQRLTTQFELGFCYPYSTRAGIQVCVDTDYRNEKTGQKVCTIGSERLSGQGSPLAIVEVESLRALPLTAELPDLVKPKFQIRIRNLGGGVVINKQGVVRQCTSRGGEVSEDTFTLQAYLSDIPLACRLEEESEVIVDEVTLDRRQEFSMICELTEGISTTYGTYLGNLQIILEYGYVQTLSHQLTLIR